ncbi:uncharacterized protein BDZ99DRAFT_523641 [Mytilinidion resinicola]|uniref:Uncharacterized protein n=1 Tax=Mytilinidion resinicola TaxID=574789 RepID=A0A6A6YCD5_9PEZI|nr:uncharacterized protein BDZ99DRAFT_523641 [Mytilinidion resinicola]KAF2806173.1 hypothetical protein BDZ99DRAFT_523641 [Mytilinidion resinicola]
MEQRMALRKAGHRPPSISIPPNASNPHTVRPLEISGPERQETWHERQLRTNAFYRDEWRAKVEAGLNPQPPDPSKPLLTAPDELVILSEAQIQALRRELEFPSQQFTSYSTESEGEEVSGDRQISVDEQVFDEQVFDGKISGGKEVSHKHGAKPSEPGESTESEGEQLSRGSPISRAKRVSGGKTSGRKQSRSKTPRAKNPFPRTAAPMPNSRTSEPTSTMPKRTQSAARVVLKEPVFEPTARAAIEAKHEPRLNALINRQPDPEENNPYAVTIVRQDLRNVEPHRIAASVDETTAKKLSLKSPRKLIGFLTSGFRPDPVPQLPANVPPKASRLLVSPPKKHRFRSKKVERSATSNSLPKPSIKSQSEKDMTKASGFASLASRFHTRNPKQQPRPHTARGRSAHGPRPHTSHVARTHSSGNSVSQSSIRPSSQKQPAGKALRQAVEAELASKPLPPQPDSDDSSTDYSGVIGSYGALDPIPNLPRPATQGRSGGSDATVAAKYCPPKAAEYHGVMNVGMRVFSQHAKIEEGSADATPGAVQDDNHGDNGLPATFYSPSHYTVDTIDRASGFRPSRNVDPARYIVASPARPPRQQIAQPQPVSTHSRLASQGTIRMIFQGDAKDITPGATVDNTNPNTVTPRNKAAAKRSSPQHHTPTLRQLEGPARTQLVPQRPLAPKHKMIANLQDDQQERQVLRRRPGSADMKNQANRPSSKHAHASSFHPQHPSALPMPLYANGRSAMYGIISSASPTHGDGRPPTHAESGAAAQHDNESSTLGRHGIPAPGHNVALIQPYLAPPPEHAYFASPISDTFSPTATALPMPAVLHDGSDVLTHFGVVNHHMDMLHHEVIGSFDNLHVNLDKSGDDRQKELLKELDARLPPGVVLAGLREANEPKLDEVMTLLKDNVVVSLGKITDETTGSKDKTQSIQQKLDKQQKTLEAILDQLKQITAMRSNNSTQSGHHPRRSHDIQRGTPDPHALRVNHFGQEGGIVSGRPGRQFASEVGTARSDSNINLVRQHPDTVDGTYYNQFPNPGQVIGTFGGITYVQGNPLPHNGPANYENNGPANFAYGYDSRR